MNTLVIYFSKFGNTHKVAECIRDECKTYGPARAIDLEDLTLDDFHNVDLLIMGSPTHRMNLPERVRIRLAELPKGSLRHKAVAVFDTSYKMSAWLNLMTASKKLGRKLKKLGGSRVGRPETFHVMEAEGPLYEGELERARIWVGTILQKVGN